MKGRKPKPTVMKKLAGNPGKRPLNQNEPQPPVPDKVPRAPRFLNRYAKREWYRMLKILLPIGLYTEVDLAALAMYCQAFGRWVIAELKVQEQGLIRETDKGYEYKSVWRSEADKAMEQMRKLLPEFGLTPSSRARLSITRPEEPDELEKLLFGKMAEVSRK